jgi:SRSO17 transposase
MHINLDKQNEFDPRCWGLVPESVADLGQNLYRVHDRYRGWFKTKTHDSSEHALTYLRGALTMDTKRNYANMARRVAGFENDGQNLQQFMSDSPWPVAGIYKQIQSELTAYPEIQDGMLTLDESADEKAGNQSAGARRQYLGREGKVDVGQMSVVLGYHSGTTWAMVDAELYMPEEWFDEAHADLRRREHVPKDCQYATKQSLGLRMIRRAVANHLPFRVIGCDSNYGRDSQFRADLQAEHLTYIADVPENQVVYLAAPLVGVPPTPADHRGPPFTQPRVLNQASNPPLTVQQVAILPTLAWDMRSVLETERGPLFVDCALCRVWTVTSANQVFLEWLLIQRDAEGKTRYSLFNAPADTSRTQLVRWQHQRYYAERIFQDAKTEAGWAEFMARKYRAWQHHTALDALALWFIAQTKLDWARAHPPDPTLCDQLQLNKLPVLSFANVRELLKATLPLPHLTPDEATALVVTHLVNRSSSTRSRRQNQRRNEPKT